MLRRAYQVSEYPKYRHVGKLEDDSETAGVETMSAFLRPGGQLGVILAECYCRTQMGSECTGEHSVFYN